MLGFAIRINDERNETFFRSRNDFLNEFIIGSLVEEAKVFMDKESANTFLDSLNTYVNKDINGKRIIDHIKEVNPRFTGFEVVDITFERAYYIITLDIDERISYIKSVEYNDDIPLIASSQCIDDAMEFHSQRNAENEIKNMILHGYTLGTCAKAEIRFEGVQVF